ncbi:hypothetical protein MHYP_G00061620 [Metynnis hypsauchen]
MATAKEECIIRKLADLRARGPEPPMVSELNLDDATYAKPRSITPEDEEPMSRSPSPPSDTQCTEPPLSALEEQATASTSADPKFLVALIEPWSAKPCRTTRSFTPSQSPRERTGRTPDSARATPHAHVKAFHSETSGLTNAQFDRILLQFKKLQKDNSRRTKAHQQTVKWNKSKLLRPSSDYETFMHIARYRVPRLTDMIRRRPQVNLFKLLQGYLAGYLGILTGHRPVVLTNRQKDKVLQAEVDDNNRALVWVDHHKTDRTFGNAYMALLPHKVDWLKGLIEVSTAHFSGEQCPFVFQFEGKQLYKLNCELKAAWHHSRMQGQISFGLIRTAIANQAKKHLPAKERKLMCEAMCHDVSTADRFYTSVPEIGDVFHIRDLRMKAMEHDNGMEPDIQSTDNEAGLTATSDSDNEA